MNAAQGVNEVRVHSVPWTQWSSLRENWNDLVTASPRPSFFLTADWVETWLETFGPSLQPQFLFFGEEACFIGACMLVQGRQRHGPISIRRVYLNMAGEESADGTCIEFNDLICRPGAEEAVVSALLNYLKQQSWDELVLEGFQAGPVLDALQRAFGAHAWRVIEKPSYYVDLDAIRSSGKGFEESLSSKTRRNIVRSRDLYLQQGEITVECAADTDSALRMLRELADLHQRTWTARGESGSFSSEKFVAFHRSLIRRTFSQGSIQLIKVCAGKETIGILYNFYHAGKVYYYQSGFHYVEDNRYSPGMVTLSAAIQECMRLGCREFDFLAGDAQHKRWLGTGARKLQWVVAERDTLIVLAVRWLRKVKAGYQKSRGGSNAPGVAPT